MQKLANFIINRRNVLLIIILAAAGFCGFLTSLIPVNKDMTKYLSKKSNMQKGLVLMQEQFPEMKEPSSFRVMFDDLSDAEKTQIKKDLEHIPYVKSVTYELESAEYNKDNHTLFIVSTDYDYGTNEVRAIEKSLASDFSQYKTAFSSNNTQPTAVPVHLVALAMGIVLVVLFLMGESWLEPILYMLTIGTAIVINLGTSIFFPYLAEITVSMGPILQLALSMDYSIMLMSRYRQERHLYDDRIEAMKSALAHSFSSIASSSITTAAGLLTLVFLTFKLGPEIAIVMAKGVFISMICVFIMLPFLILKFEKILNKTAKKSLHIKLDFLAKFSYKARFVMPIVFIALVVAFAFIQSKTGISFTEGNRDLVAEVFPKDNPVVLLYENSDEDKVNEIVSVLEKDTKVKNVFGYSNTLGKNLTASEMTEAISVMTNMGGITLEAPIDKSIIQLLYYLYYDGKISTISAEDFFKFIREYIVRNKLISAYMDGDMTENIAYLEKFGSKSNLVTEFNINQMADFFGVGKYNPNSAVSNPAAKITKDDIANLYLYYYTKKKVNDYGSMTLPEFADFLANTVSKNEIYSSMIPPETAAQLSALQTFTNKDEVTKKISYHDAAKILGMDDESLKMLYVYYYSQDSGYRPADVVYGEFLSFLQNDVSKNPLLKEHASESDMKKLEKFGGLISNKKLQKKFTPSELAKEVHEDEESIKFILTYKDAQNGKFERSNFLSIKQIIDYLVGNQDNPTLSAAIGDNADNLKIAHRLIDGTIEGTSYTPGQLSFVLRIDHSQLEDAYLLYKKEKGDTADWLISPKEFIAFIVDDVLTNKQFESFFDANSATQLHSVMNLVDAILSDKMYDASEMCSLLEGLSDEISLSRITLLYLYYESIQNSDENWLLTVPMIFNYIHGQMIHDPRFGDVFDKQTRDVIEGSKTLLDEGIAQMKGEKYSRTIFMTSYPEESTATTEFMARLDDLRSEKLSHTSYLIGMSEMVYEMQNNFPKEFSFITIITAAAIFIVVLLSFRNVAIPLLLTMMVQCGVFITVAVIGWRGGSIYYLALLIVQSILMGATIDYAIVLSNYYRENRKNMDVLTALQQAYAKSIHTIATSGLILILATAIIGIFSTVYIIAQVGSAISIGALVAVMLILLVLPGTLAAFDRFVAGKNRKK